MFFAAAWKLYLDANPNFNPPTASYALTITCADAWGSTSGTATITMVANAFPVIDGVPTSVSINEADAGGTSIYTVTVSDAEGDAISCTIDSITPTSAASAFTMVKPAAGIIFTTAFILYVMRLIVFCAFFTLNYLYFFYF